MNILITGGTGFFGRAFSAFLLENGLAEKVVIFSRDEVKQAQMRLSMPQYAMRWHIGDVRDRQRLTRSMYGIDVVVHAAAMKRIETCMLNPDECKKTNVDGTQNVIDAAIDAGVDKVVFLSSDKAYQPISIYGNSKAMAESMILNANNITGKDGTRFSAVRYGNIANSTGSVIPSWRKILETSDTVPVTDPACTRFFMRVEESVDLVWNTIQEMQGGELNIPELPAYELADLASALGAKMDIGGLPAHEKLAESMCEGKCSDTARRMSVEELMVALESIK